MEQFKIPLENGEENLTEIEPVTTEESAKQTLSFSERAKEIDRLRAELRENVDVLEEKIKAVLDTLSSPQDLSKQYIKIMELNEPFRAIAVAKEMLLKAQLQETFREFVKRKENLIKTDSDYTTYAMVLPVEKTLNKILDDYNDGFKEIEDIGRNRYNAISALKSENSNLRSKMEEYRKVSF